jgi:hypothetical protein
MEAGMNRSVYPKAQRIIEKEFLKAKAKVISDFENAAPSVALSNIAQLDRSERGMATDEFIPNGNLYTFFGFENDRDPVQEVKDILFENIELQPTIHQYCQ